MLRKPPMNKRFGRVTSFWGSISQTNGRITTNYKETIGEVWLNYGVNREHMANTGTYGELAERGAQSTQGRLDRTVVEDWGQRTTKCQSARLDLA
jgi:hypothetical protein